MKISEATTLRILGLLSIAFVVAFVMIYVPAAIYAANEIDFPFPLVTLLAVGLPWAALASLLLSLPLAALSKRLLSGVSAAWFALAICVWVSASFLLVDIGVLDGRNEIAVSVGHKITSGMILPTIVALSFLAASRAPQRALVAITCLSLFQLGIAFFNVVAVSPRSELTPEAHPASVNELFRLSDQKNVLVVVLDTFQSTLFEDYLENFPDVRDDFSGFTFYRNTVGSAPTTYASMPPIHSGIRFDPDRSLKESYQQLVHSDSFVARLARAGYKASMVNPITRACPDGASCLEDYQVSDGTTGRASFAYLSLLDMSLLRVAPAQLKSWVFHRGAWRARRLTEDRPVQVRSIRHQRLLKKFADSIHVADGPPTVKFIHLMTTHPPIEMSNACDPLPEPLKLTRENFEFPVNCSIHAIRDLLDRLKGLNVYDVSFVAVMADHGADILPNTQSSKTAGTAMPLLLAKPIGANGPMETSDKSAEIRDLAATICKDTSDCQSLGGTPLDEITSSRKRSYFYYRWKHEYWNDERIRGVTKYLIDGPVWRSASWTRVKPPILPEGQDLQFNADFPERAKFLDWGWSVLEPWGVWTDGPSAQLSFSTPSPPPRTSGTELRRFSLRCDRNPLALSIAHG